MKINIPNIRVALIIFTIIYVSDDTYLFGSTGEDYIFTKIKYLLYLILIVWNIRWISKSNVAWLLIMLSSIAMDI